MEKTLLINLTLPVTFAMVGLGLRYFGNEQGQKASHTVFVASAITLFVVTGIGVYRYTKQG